MRIIFVGRLIWDTYRKEEKLKCLMKKCWGSNDSESGWVWAVEGQNGEARPEGGQLQI